MIGMFRNQLTTNNMDSEECALMTPPEMATYLGIGRNLAYQLLSKGIIHGFKIGCQWKVSKEAVDLFIAQQSGIAI